MSNTTNEPSSWQAVVDAHPLESHVAEDWLRYGVALLQTMEPGPDLGKQLQQAALAFVQAQKEGASTEAVATAQQHSVLISLIEALTIAGIDTKTLEPLTCALGIQCAPSIIASPANGTTSSDADIANAISTLVDLYSLDLPVEASLKQQILSAKQQLNQRGLTSAGIRLALNHARVAQKDFSQAAVETLLAKLA